MRGRRYYAPYFYELHQKEDASHDCSNCTGNCQAGHNIKLAEIKESIARIKDLPNRLQMMSLPLHSETLYPGRVPGAQKPFGIAAGYVDRVVFCRRNLPDP